MKSILLLFLSLSGSFAAACPVCGFGQDGTAEGFILTTAILTAMPLFLFGGVIYFLIKRHKRLSNED